MFTCFSDVTSMSKGLQCQDTQEKKSQDGKRVFLIDWFLGSIIGVGVTTPVTEGSAGKDTQHG